MSILGCKFAHIDNGIIRIDILGIQPCIKLSTVIGRIKRIEIDIIVFILVLIIRGFLIITTNSGCGEFGKIIIVIILLFLIVFVIIFIIVVINLKKTTINLLTAITHRLKNLIILVIVFFLFIRIRDKSEFFCKIPIPRFFFLGRFYLLLLFRRFRSCNNFLFFNLFLRGLHDTCCKVLAEEFNQPIGIFGFLLILEILVNIRFRITKEILVILMTLCFLCMTDLFLLGNLLLEIIDLLLIHGTTSSSFNLITQITQCYESIDISLCTLLLRRALRIERICQIVNVFPNRRIWIDIQIGIIPNAFQNAGIKFFRQIEYITLFMLLGHNYFPPCVYSLYGYNV